MFPGRYEVSGRTHLDTFNILVSSLRSGSGSGSGLSGPRLGLRREGACLIDLLACLISLMMMIMMIRLIPLFLTLTSPHHHHSVRLALGTFPLIEYLTKFCPK